MTTAQSSAPPSQSQQAAAIDERLSNAERAIIFSIAPLTSTRLARAQYPESEAVRSVVPENDVMRYALGRVMDLAATSEDSKQIFLALGQHFAVLGTAGFVRHPDSRFPVRRLAPAAHASGSLLDLLTRVPKACDMTRPSAEEEDSKRRGLLMLNQLGEH
jgi:multisubunit Na+/H+ antiporter MnhG subunit